MIYFHKKIRIFRDRLNYLICLNLTKTRKNSKITFKIEITDYTVQFLIRKYQITGRFKKCNLIFSDLELDSENLYNDDDSHSVKIDTFEIRIMRRKAIEIKTRTKNKLRIFAPVFLSVRFTRYNQVHLNEFDKINLLRIRHL
jgi:hypothetical protein